MADWLVGPVMEKIINKCFEYFEDQVIWQTGMKEELERLRVIHPQIQNVLSVYTQVEINDKGLNKWYWQLRDAIDEADDVLDDFDYLQKQANKNMNKRKFIEISQPAVQNDPDLKRLEEAVQKLGKISAEVSSFLHLLDSAKQEKRETGAEIKNVLLGRRKETEIVSQWLRKSVETQSIDTTDLYRNISLLSVVGHDGMGKTTLLQHVYNKDATLFDVKSWVCVSTNFDAKTVIKSVLESLQNQRPLSESLAVLQRSLQSEVTSKRFLLVLDDIWEVDDSEWENVLTPLQYGSSGSRILITTRMNSVVSKISMIKNKKILPLKGLMENECFLLFKTHAFGKNSNVDQIFLSMAGDIVKKLSGCPLAAKVIGSSLMSKDLSYWRKVTTDIENVSQNDILSLLKLSYTYLPKFLQNCFSFCSIFPKDHKFDMDDLVRMWISLSFIQSSNNSLETLEETGRKYFDILVEKSFFDKFQYEHDSVYYQMHDLLHDLAQLVCRQESFRAANVKELSNPPKTIRHLHLSLDIDSSVEVAFKEMREFKNLRSLFLSYPTHYDEENFVDLISKILEASKSIRLLYISAHYQIEISEMIGCLTHLRYIHLKSSVNKLPRSISQLYNLRYLILPFHDYCNIYEIGKLKSLQELSCFYVKNEIGYGIEELEHMNELRQISIHQLENIKVAEEALSAKFYDKKNLTDLSLQWGDNFGDRKNIVDHDLDEKILDVIKPSNNLKKLHINAYMGVRSAIWMTNVSVISNLEYIKLEQCLKWKTLPPFGQLPFLKSLYLRNMPEIEHLDHNKDCLFSSLEVLHIENLEALYEWFDTTIAVENGCLLPCLTELCLKNCPKLQELPFLPIKLQRLEIDNIGWKGWNWLQGIRNYSSIDIRDYPNLIRLIGRQELKTTNENCELIIDELVINDPSLLLLEPLRSISSLRILKIVQNDELVSFPSEIEQRFLQLSSSLFKLIFQNLQYIEFLPSSLESLYSLKDLEVSDVPQLKMLPNPPVSLVTLKLHYLKSLQCLPSSLLAISSLETLKLINIPLLKSLPDLPSSLKELAIEKLESLQCLPSSLSTISSLWNLKLKNIPLLKSLPDLPSSLRRLELEELKSLQCLPYSLSAISFLTNLTLKNIPLLQLLPNLPSSLERLELEKLKSLECLPSSLSAISSLDILELKNIPLLKSLPDLPSSLSCLFLMKLGNMDCLHSCLPTLSRLEIFKVPQLLELPELPASLKLLHIYDCDPKLMESYPNFYRGQ